MKKTILLGILMICFLIFGSHLSTSVTLVDFKEETNNTNPSITVRGGFGITIFVYGVDDETTIGATVDGAYLWYGYMDEYLGNRILIQLQIIDIIGNEFTLYVFVDNQVWAFQCHSFLDLFVYGITPIEM